jgi:hypothetical protein
MRTFATDIHFSNIVYTIFLKWIQWLHLGRDTRGALLIR